MKIDILGVRFDDLTLSQAAERGAELLQQPAFHYVVTPNPEFILAARSDSAFRDLLNAADLTIPDGIGVIYAAKLLGTPLAERVPGIEFAACMLETLDKTGGRLFLLGAKDGVAAAAADQITQQYPGLTICGVHHGYFGADEEEQVAQLVAESRPDLLFVCLGAPRQEKWIAQWGPETGCRLAIGLGGVLDVFAGTVDRAPEGWRKLGLEWLYRLCKEPKRFGRMARLPLVLIYALGARITGKGR